MSSTCQCPCWKDPARKYTRSELANHVPNWKHWCDTMWVFYKDFCHIRKHAEQPAKFKKKHNCNKKRTVKIKTKNHDVASVTSWYCSLSSWKSMFFFHLPVVTPVQQVRFDEAHGGPWPQLTELLVEVSQTLKPGTARGSLKTTLRELCRYMPWPRRDTETTTNRLALHKHNWIYFSWIVLQRKS